MRLAHLIYTYKDDAFALVIELFIVSLILLFCFRH